MVFVWGWGPRRRRPQYGPGYGRYGRGYGPGYGRGYGPPPGYGYRGGGGGGSCLRDLLFLETGCCLAQALGCGTEMLLVAPATTRQLVREGTAGGGPAERMVAAIGVYRREISPRRPPCCRFSPTCSAYGIEAIRTHGARRGGWLTLRRLLRCRPGAAGGVDPVPAAVRVQRSTTARRMARRMRPSRSTQRNWTACPVPTTPPVTSRSPAPSSSRPRR